MVCKKCGFEIDEECEVCSECGSPLVKDNTDDAFQMDLDNNANTDNSAEPGIINSDNISPGDYIANIKDLLYSKKYVALVISIIVVVILVIALILLNINSAANYENTLDKYFKSLANADTNNYISLLSDDYLNYDKTYSSKEEYKEYLEKQLKNSQEVFRWYCGEDFQITYDIISSISYTKEEINEQSLFNNTYGKENNIDESIDVTIDVTVSGSESTEKTTSVISLVKIKNRWYLSENYLDN